MTPALDSEASLSSAETPAIVRPVDARRFARDLGDLIQRILGALERGAVGQLHGASR